MLWLIRTLIGFVVFVAVVVWAANWLPSWLRRVQVPMEYEDLRELEGGRGVWLDPPPFRKGRVLAYRVGRASTDIGFGVIVAEPGDSVRVRAGQLTVNGEAVRDWTAYHPYQRLPDLGPMIVPAQHWFVVSHRHQYDSLTQGPIGLDRIAGMVRE